jgi:hypothetical protein
MEKFSKAVYNESSMESSEEINIVILMWIAKIKEYYDGSIALIEACIAEKQLQSKNNRKGSMNSILQPTTGESKLPSIEFLAYKNLKFIGNVLQNIVNHNRKYPFLYSFSCMLLSKFSHLYADIKNVQICNFAIGILIGMLNNPSIHVIRTFYESDPTIWTSSTESFNIIWVAMEYKSLLFVDEITLYRAIEFFIGIITSINIDEWEMKILERVNKIFVFLVFHPNIWIRKCVAEYFITLQRQINSIALWYNYGRPLLLSCIKDKSFTENIELTQLTSHPLPRIIFDISTRLQKQKEVKCTKDDYFSYTLIKDIIINKIADKKSEEIEDYDKLYEEYFRKAVVSIHKHKFEPKQKHTENYFYIETIIDVDNFIDKKYYPSLQIEVSKLQELNTGLNTYVDQIKIKKVNKALWSDMYNEQWICKSLCIMKMSNIDLGKSILPVRKLLVRSH